MTLQTLGCYIIIIYFIYCNHSKVHLNSCRGSVKTHTPLKSFLICLHSFQSLQYSCLVIDGQYCDATWIYYIIYNIGLEQTTTLRLSPQPFMHHQRWLVLATTHLLPPELWRYREIRSLYRGRTKLALQTQPQSCKLTSGCRSKYFVRYRPDTTRAAGLRTTLGSLEPQQMMQTTTAAPGRAV